MSSTKPEIHNILHCRQEDRAMATGNMNRKFRKSGHVVLGICDQTYISSDPQIYRHSDHNTSRLSHKRSNNVIY